MKDEESLPSEEERRAIEARLRKHNLEILAKAKQPDNQWYTGEEFHHEPNLLECIAHLENHLDPGEHFHA